MLNSKLNNVIFHIYLPDTEVKTWSTFKRKQQQPLVLPLSLSGISGVLNIGMKSRCVFSLNELGSCRWILSQPVLLDKT